MNARRGSLVVASLLACVASACRLPDLKVEEREPQPLPQTSFLYAADGSLITALHAEQNRVLVPFDEIPESVRDAVIAIEDQRFYEHRGIDLRALVRAAYVDATEGRIVEGGSTITQQLVKNTYLGSDRTLSRKIREAMLAWRLEHELSKDEILTRYLNTVYFGEGSYGIQAAAETYFDRSAQDLSLSQAALLAGLISAPSTNDPVTHPQRAMARRGLVLGQMLRQGMIDQEEYEHAVRARLRLHLTPPAGRYPAPYFVDYFKRWFLSNPRFGETEADRYRLLFEGGLRITTTLEPRLQAAAEEAIGQVLLYPTDPHAALTAVDPRTGYVKAMVGGRDWFAPHARFARVNLALGGSTGRQAGSAFKPFALVAALERGLSPDTVYAAPGSIDIPLGDGQIWHVKNYDGASSGSLTIEQATINSVNTVYAQIIRDVGPERVIDVARRMGIRCCRRTAEPTTPLKPYLSSVLGTNEVNTLEMASAYGTFATDGYHVQPTPVIRMTTADGEVLYEADPRPDLVVNRAVIGIANGILQEVVQLGTGTAANIGRPQIGKTGTGEEWRDAWFAGAIPQLSAAVWVGFPQGAVSMVSPRVRIPQVLGGTWPAQIWRAFMINATQHVPVRDFPTPEVQYVVVAVDATQGCLPNQYTPPQDVVQVQYIAGTEPRDVCQEPTSYSFASVPSVIGLRQDDATGVLQTSGFNVSVSIQSSTTVPAGVVISQDPLPGEEAQQASAVTIVVAKAETSPAPGSGEVAVPRVVGVAEADAVAALQALGLVPAVVRDAQCDRSRPNCHYAPGIVWMQSPSGDTIVDVGSTIVVRVNP